MKCVTHTNRQETLSLGGTLDVPYFCVAVLPGGNQRLVVEPNEPRNLGLRMGILDNGMLGRAVDIPNDDCRVERTAGHQQRVWRKGDTVDTGVVEAPFLFVGRLILRNAVEDNLPVGIARHQQLIVG